MAGNVLVDSSFYIDRLRAGEDPLEEITRHADDIDFVTCGVVVAEVLRGMRGKSAHKRMAEFLGCMIFVPTSNAIWERVYQLSWELDRAGKVMQLTDLIIAASALHADAAVLTLDLDFHRVPGLRVISELR